LFAVSISTYLFRVYTVYQEYQDRPVLLVDLRLHKHTLKAHMLQPVRGGIPNRDVINIYLNSFLHFIFKLVLVRKTFDLSVVQFALSHVTLILLVHFLL